MMIPDFWVGVFMGLSFILGLIAHYYYTHWEGLKMIFKKKKATKKKEKNKVKEFIDGKEVPNTIPELEVPVPEESEQFPDLQSVPKKEKQLSAEEVFAEGRSVGFQEGIIYILNLTQDHLQQHQEELKKKIAEKEVQQ